MLNVLKQDRVFTAIILLVGALLLMISGALARFDYVFYDLNHYFSNKPIPNDVVIIAIDEHSLNKLGKWPWSRETHAVLLQQLRKSKTLAIGFDILFSEPDIQYPQDDDLLAQAIKESGNVVLPVVIESAYQGASSKQTNPMALFANEAASLGRVNVPLDGDGIARSIYIWGGVPEAGESIKALPHFSQSLLDVAGLLPEKFKVSPPILAPGGISENEISHNQKRIQFYGPPGSFEQISYVSVWSGEIPQSYFDNKIVLVGATAVGIGDVLATPMSGNAKPMAGVEFNANAIETLRQENDINDISTWPIICISLLLVVVPLLWLPNLRPLTSLILIFFYLIALVLVAAALPIFLNIWFPPSSILLMVLLAYPVWSWRRLERAYTYLNVEMQNLKADLMQYGMKTGQAVIPKNSPRTILAKHDLLQSRISELQYASKLLRDLQSNRNDALAFISHDIRMPIATAIMLLNEPDSATKSARVIAMLDQANKLADSFLSISKAETATFDSFREIELSGLLQEVADHVYYMANERNIKINLKLQENGVWIAGDFSLLHRAFVNVLNNSVKFSPNNAQIDIVLTESGGEAVVQIKDYGKGIEPEKLSVIFNKFSQVDESRGNIRGSGLGLYFVELTVRKHEGRVMVESELGQFTKMTMRFPIMEASVEE